MTEAIPMSAKTDNFIGRIAPLAVEDMKKTGVLASLTIAQAILESGWGESTLAKNYNNLFGIKADSSWKGESVLLEIFEFYDTKMIPDKVTISEKARISRIENQKELEQVLIERNKEIKARKNEVSSS